MSSDDVSNLVEKLLPAQADGHWRQICEREQDIHRKHLAIKGDSQRKIFRGQPVYTREEIRNRPNFFRNGPPQPIEYEKEYDLLYHFTHDYDKRLARDDRKVRVSIDINAEEKNRVVPIRSSGQYGLKIHEPLEEECRAHRRVETISKASTYCNGPSIPMHFKHNPQGQILR